MKKIMLPLILMVLSIPLTAAGKPSPVILTDKTPSIPVGKSMEIFADSSGKMTFYEIKKQKNGWKQAKKETPGFGFTGAVYWARFTVKNKCKGKSKWYLETAYPMLDYITFHVSDSDGGYSQLEGGDMHLFYDRFIKYRNMVFPFTIKEGHRVTCYIKVKTESSMNLPLKIWDIKSFNEHISIEQIILGIYYGGMIIMLIYNIFLLMGIRYKSYVYYILYIAGYILFQMTLNGLAFQYLWPGSIVWANICLPFFMMFSNIWLQLFNMAFLNSRKHSRTIHLIFFSLLGLSVIGTIIPFIFSYAAAIRYATAIIFISVSNMLVCGYIFLFKGYRSARIYVFAWTFFLVGVAVYALKTFGLMPNNFFTNWSIQIGSISVVVLLSLALADQINILRMEKTEALTDLNVAYSRFVPHEFLKLLEKQSVLDISLGDQIQKEITILFSDIRNFTELSESMSPEENFNFINSYLKRISPIIRKHKGFIDKFIGDGIMALFAGNPLDALNSAVEIQAEMIEYNIHRSKYNYQPITIGIGLHGGSVMLGTIGEEERIDGTVIADTVNLAARIEGLTKKFGSSIIISEYLFNQVKDNETFHFRRLGKVRVKGKNKSVPVIEVLEGYQEEIYQRKLATFDNFQRGMEAFIKKKNNTALEEFKSVLEIDPDDLVAQFFLERVQARF